MANFRQTNAWKEVQWCDRPVASPAGAWGCLQAGFPVLVSFQNKKGLCTCVSEAQVNVKEGRVGFKSDLVTWPWIEAHGSFSSIGKKQEMSSQNMQKPSTFHHQNDKNGWSENISKLTMP